MKHKRRPEDFTVKELTQFAASAGPFALYRLTKRWLGTPEAVAEILQRWHLSRDRVSCGGLKDFHGVTEQHLTIRGGPRRNMDAARFRLEYLGPAPRAFDSKDVTGNRFEVVVRDLSPPAVAASIQELTAAEQTGVPNYFDDQRFGSVGESGQFIAHPWCLGDYERALWLALADPNPHDSAADREWKRLLREHWGDWNRCRPNRDRNARPGAAAPGPRKDVLDVVQYLCGRPRDFRGAIARLRVDLRSLYVAAFQSHLWNQLLAGYLRERCRPEQLREVPLRLGRVPFHFGLDAEQSQRLREAELPLPSARLKLEPGLIERRLNEVLSALGLTPRQLRIKYPRDTFFSKGFRPAVFRPAVRGVSHAADDLHPGQQKLLVAFDLPRGSYATIVLKRIAPAPCERHPA